MNKLLSVCIGLVLVSVALPALASSTVTSTCKGMAGLGYPAKAERCKEVIDGRDFKNAKAITVCTKFMVRSYDKVIDCFDLIADKIYSPEADLDPCIKHADYGRDDAFDCLANQPLVKPPVQVGQCHKEKHNLLYVTAEVDRALNLMNSGYYREAEMLLLKTLRNVKTQESIK